MRPRKPSPQDRGTLYVVATPIGNLDDLTIRALKTLAVVDFIACEDTRRTRKLLTRFGLKTKLMSYFQPKEQQKMEKIIDLLQHGSDIALVSDAGTPGISDPGYPLIRRALEEHIDIVPIPGVSAVTAALSAAGLPTHRFLFLGFLPAKKAAALELLRSLSEEPGTLIFYLPARKLPGFIPLLQETLGPRRMVVAREITKTYEEFLRGSPEEILSRIPSAGLKGEVTVLIEGKVRKKRRNSHHPD